MANPQLEDGYTAISNDVLQALARIRVPGEATQVLFVILRKTWGFRKKFDRIPLSQFCEATGLLRPNVVRAIKVLLSMKLIYKNPSSSINSDTGRLGSINSDTGRLGSINSDTGYITSYCFNKDFESWRPGGSINSDTGSINSDTTQKDYRLTIDNNSVFDGSIKTDTTQTASIKTDTLKRNIYINNNNIVGFEELWKDYPRKDGKKEAERHFTASVKCDKDMEDIRTALVNYKRHLEIETWKQPKNGSTWFNNWRDWVEWKEEGSAKNGKSDRPQTKTSADRAAEVLMAIGQGGGDEGRSDKDISGLQPADAD